MFAQNVMVRIHSILRTERYAKLVGWIALSTELGEMDDFAAPLPAMTAVVADHMSRHLPEETAHRLAKLITYHLAVTAIGEGLIGPAIQSALSMTDDDADGAVWLGEHWKKLLEDALNDRR